MISYFDKIFKKEFEPIYKSGASQINNNLLSTNKFLNTIENMKNDGTEEIAHEIFKSFGDKKILNIVVLGAGSGKMGNHLANFFTESNIYDVDKNVAVVERLKHKFKKNNQRIAILGDAMDIPLKDNSIDLIIGYSLLRYVEDSDKVFSSVCRILKKGGHAVFIEARRENIINDFYKKIKVIENNCRLSNQNNILMSRTSFFYYLINKSKNDVNLKNKINALALDKGINFYEAALEAAGKYLGTLYYVYYTKQ